MGDELEVDLIEMNRLLRHWVRATLEPLFYIDEDVGERLGRMRGLLQLKPNAAPDRSGGR